MDSFPSPSLPTTDLEIEVSNFLGMKVVHPIQDLFYETGGFLLTQRFLLGQEVEELSSRHSARYDGEGPGPGSPVCHGHRPTGAAPEPDPQAPCLAVSPLLSLGLCPASPRA